MRCANTEALNNYHNELEKIEVSYNLFLDSIDDDLVELQDLISAIKSKAKDYDGYDFEEEVNDLVKDCL